VLTSLCIAHVLDLASEIVAMASMVIVVGLVAMRRLWR